MLLWYVWRRANDSPYESSLTRENMYYGSDKLYGYYIYEYD